MATTELPVSREENGHRASVFIEKDGKRIAEMTFSRVNDKKWIIDHTEVDDSLRGQGAGRKLLDFAVDFARKNEVKYLPLCPFAKAQFEKDSSIRDVLDA